MNIEKVKYVIYVRKSTEPEGRQVLSIPSQLRDVALIAKREKLTVIDTIVETRSAATPYNRPAYTDMIAKLKKGEADGIIVWHIDRLARNELEFGELKHLLQIGVIKSIWTMSREYRSADNGLLMSLEASMATQYSRDLADKVRSGLKQKCLIGQPPILARLGYLNTKFQEHGTNKIIVDPDRWHIVRKGFDLLLSRQYNVPEIAYILNTVYGLTTRNSGKKIGRALNRSVLYRMFADPFYYGYFFYKGTLHKGSYQQMITIEEFDLAQEILGRKGRPRHRHHQFTFTGLMKCGSCGCAITASIKTKFVKSDNIWRSYTFYHCTKRKGTKVCDDKRYTTLAELETLIRSELANYHLHKDFQTWAIQILREGYKDEIEKQQMLITDAQTNEFKIIKEMDVLLDLRIASTITEEKYLEKKAEKEAQLLRINEIKKRLQSGDENWFDQLTEKLNVAAGVLQKFDSKVPEAQKEACINFGWNWTLKARKLLISKLEWFEAIKEYADFATSIFGVLEPQKTFDSYGEKASLAMLRPAVRRLCNHIRTTNGRRHKM